MEMKRPKEDADIVIRSWSCIPIHFSVHVRGSLHYIKTQAEWWHCSGTVFYSMKVDNSKHASVTTTYDTAQDLPEFLCLVNIQAHYTTWLRYW